MMLVSESRCWMGLQLSLKVRLKGSFSHLCLVASNNDNNDAADAENMMKKMMIISLPQEGKAEVYTELLQAKCYRELQDVDQNYFRINSPIH